LLQARERQPGVRARVGLLDHDSDLIQSIIRGKDFAELKLPDKIAATQLDNKMAGQGDEDDAHDEIAELIRACTQ
jgi:hypothetical protein